MAQSVERILGKDEVTGSIPVSSSKKSPAQMRGAFFMSCYMSCTVAGLKLSVPKRSRVSN